ncbi:prostatic acid phosphatase-like isoform X2 [Anoplophora glabripennis]|nr:prostatic acid phosphatase-like isoform X2 [Anoplophora glabripennis]
MIRRIRTTLLAMTVVTIIFLTITILVSIQAKPLEGRQLELLHVVMRHGIRTPASTYPNDPYVNHTFYPVGWGQLTNEGKVQLYDIGKFLRERYGDFLGNHYSPDLYYTQSTDVDRTKASMQLVNAGLWPPEETQKWGPIDWQPIPIYSEPLDQDMLLLVRKPCAQYHIERDKVINSEEVKNLFKYYEPLFKELTEVTGQNVTDFDGVQDVFSTLQAEEAFNLTLPEWIQQYYPDRMLEPTTFSFVLNAYNDKMNRLKGGVLLKKLLEDWRSKADGTISPSIRKAFLYGGHDSTISNIMSTLKIWDPQIPGYGVTILFELWKDLATDKYGVEIYLRNSTSVPPHKMTLPGCDTFCPLEKLVTLTKDVIPEKWEEECKTSDETYIVPPSLGP